MPTRKIIVCLANSRKHMGRCVAGIELEGSRFQGWVRPVSDRAGAEVSEEERQYEDGSDPRLLDIISVPIIEAVGSGYQPENWLLDPDHYWVLTGRATWKDLVTMESVPTDLWPSDAVDTYNGLNDRVTLDEIDGIDHSLRLIRVESLEVKVFAPGAAFGNPQRRVQGSFTYLDVSYRIWISDPMVEEEFRAKPDGLYNLGECFLTISLSEPHSDGHCYKLIAGVFERGNLNRGST